MKTNSFLNRALSLLLTVALLMSMVVVPVHAADVASGTHGDNISWTLDSAGTLTISGTGEMGIDECGWLQYADSIKTVVIQPGVTSVKDWAFGGCGSLQQVTLPAGLTSIGSYAFISCSALTEVEIPDSVTALGGDAFTSCTALETVDLGSGLIEIGDGAFANCEKLTSVTIPDGVTSIGRAAFSSCTALETVDLPDSLTTMGDSMFRGCESLTEIVIPNGVTELPDSTFYNCDVLEEVTLPDGLTSIGSHTFFFCTTLRSLSVPATVTSIGDRAFYRADHLRRLTLPAGLTSLGDGVFSFCYALTAMSVPAGITEIPDETFYYCTALTSVTIPAGVEYIGENAFGHCSDLTTFSIPEAVIEIGEAAFQWSGITEAAIPDGVTKIPDYAFAYTPLTKVEILGSVTRIGKYAFEGCQALTAIDLPSTVSYIGESAFSSCESLTEITVPEGVTDLYEDTFSYCNSLHTVDLPDSLTDIWNGVFAGCNELTSLTIPANVQAIEGNIFDYNYGIKGIKFAGDAPYIADNAFANMYWDLADREALIAWYPYGNSTWTESVRQNYGGNVTWKPYCVGAHTMGDWTVDYAPDCVMDGREYRACTVCSYSEERYSDALGHSYNAVVTAPTETDQGYTTYTCSNCGDSYVSDYTDPVGHTHDYIHFVEKIEPTCTEDGRDEYYYCDCGAIANIALLETTPEKLVLPATGHKNEWQYNIDGHWYECVDCGELTSPKGHDFYTFDTAPSCYAEGYTNYVCNDCGYCYIDNFIPAGHSYEAVVTAPTETEQGYTTYSCIACGNSYVSDYTDPVGHTHDYIHFVEKIEPTCTEDGRDEYYYCDCGAIANIALLETRPEDLIIPAVGHDCANAATTEPTCDEQGYTTYFCVNCDYSYMSDFTDPAGHSCYAYDHAPTCTEEGYVYYACQNCDYGYSDNYVPATGHSYSIRVEEPTCAERGYTVYSCVNCDYWYEDDYVPTTGHKNEWQYNIDGHWYECVDCGELTSPEGHDFYTFDTAPSCYAEGYTNYVCNDCGYCYIDNFIPAGHSYEAVVTAPTETEQGYTTYSCIACGNSYVSDYTDPVGHTHDYEEFIPRVEPTCTEDGVHEYYRCSCGAIANIALEETTYAWLILPATGHTWGEWIKGAPACTSDGYEYRYCQLCNAYDERTVPAVGDHTWGEWTVGMAPTCREDGYEYHYCDVCGVYEDRVIPATGDHTWNEWIVGTEAGCVYDGYEYRNCDVCGEYDERAIPAIGDHTWGEWIKGAPACTSDGSEYHYCDVCGEYEERTVPAVGEHTWGEWTVGMAPTCREDGYEYHYCDVCGVYEDRVIPATGDHTWGDWIIRNSPTCGDAGSHYRVCGVCAEYEEKAIPATGEHSYYSCSNETEHWYICRNCGYSTTPEAHEFTFYPGYDYFPPTCTTEGFTYNLYLCDCGYGTGYDSDYEPALGHDYAGVVTAPTETEQGYTTYTCRRCGDTYVGDYTDPVGHIHDYQTFVHGIEPTCTEDGLQEHYICSCGALADIALEPTTFEEQIIPALGHDNITEYTKPTCTDWGYYHQTCQRCGYYFSDIYESPTGHTYSAESFPGTCTEQGHTLYTCVDCGHWYEEFSGGFGDHNYVITEDTFPTCAAQGYRVYTCTTCGDSYTDDYVPATGHDYVAGETIAPTCTEQGCTIYTCTVCGDVYEGDKVFATGHHITEWVVAIPPSCNESGAEYGSCENCGYVEFRYMLAYHHNYEATSITYPNCMEQGYTVYTCSICGDSYQDDFVKPTDRHIWDEGVVTIEPTDTSVGYAVFTCTVCGAKKDDIIPMLGHSHTYDYTELVYPTCDTYGYTTFYCACGHWYNGDFTDPYGHRYGGWEYLSESTCTVRGVKQRQCSVCGYVDTQYMGLKSHNFVNDQCTACHRYCSTGTTEDGFEYFIDWDDNSVTITGYVGNAIDVVIPETIRDVPVVELGEHAFYRCSTMASVHIPDTVKYINRGAFANCPRLAEINIPYYVSYISETAFSGSERLTAIHVDPANEWYSSLAGVLYNDDMSTLLKCPEGWVGEYILPASVTGISDYALLVNDYMTSISVEKGNTRYAAKHGVLFDSEYSVLIRCPGGWRGEYTVPSSVILVDDYAFHQCEQLLGVTFKEGTLSIGDHAFENSCELKYIALPDSLVWIGGYAFADCDRLKTVSVPAGVEVIGDYAFLSCDGLASIDVDGDNTYYTDVAGVLFYKDLTGLIAYGGGMPGVYKIPAGVEFVCDYAFYDCDQLTKLVVSGSVEHIGAYAFDTGKSGLIVFEGDAPELDNLPFGNHDYNGDGIADGPKVARYSKHNDTWSELTGSYLNAVVWEAYEPCAAHHTYQDGICCFCGHDCVGICFNGTHEFEAGTVAPGCSGSGYTVYTCVHCGVSYHGDYVDAVGHSWDDGVVAVEPSEGMDGLKIYSCGTCGETKEVPMVLPGKVTHTTDPDANAGSGDLTEEQEGSIADAVLDQDDKDRVENGEDVNIWLEVEDITDTVEEEEKHKIHSAAGDRHVGCHFDINLYKQLGDDKAESVRETSGLVTITVKVPAEFISAGRDYVYQMVRIHNGRITIIDCRYDAATQTVSFETDRFSSYTLVYSEPAITYGDASGDDEITVRDLAMLRKYLANKDPVTGESNVNVAAGADVNGDGDITVRDLAMLRKYLANKDPETGESSVVLGPQN